MATAASALDGDDELIGPGSEPDPIFVGRAAELAQGLAALHIGHSILIKGQPGIGKRSLLREVRTRLAKERVCLCPTLATPKAFVACGNGCRVRVSGEPQFRSLLRKMRATAAAVLP